MSNWKKVAIHEIGKVVTGKTPSTKRAEYYNGDIPFVSPADLGMLKYVNKAKKTLTDEGARHAPIVPQGSILFSCIGLIGKIGIADKELRTNQQINSIIPYSQKVEGEYLYYLLLAASSNIERIAGVQVLPIINKSDFENLKVIIPTSIQKQKAIAVILQTWDKAIEKIDALIAAKEKRFRWLLDELIGNQFNNTYWKLISLGEIGEISSAGVDKKIIEGESQVRLLNYLDVYRRDKIYSKELNHYVTASSAKAKRCSIRKGDIFFTPSSEVQKDIGHSAVAMEDINGAVYSYHIIRLRPKINLDVLYSAFAFKSQYFYKEVAKYADGSGQRYVISQNNFRKITIALPSLKEQKRIACLLNTAEKEIKLLEALVDHYSMQKHGLMQKLLTGAERCK